jgi:hypothetical protein
MSTLMTLETIILQTNQLCTDASHDACAVGSPLDDIGFAPAVSDFRARARWD